jgi:hypothetical protein
VVSLTRKGEGKRNILLVHVVRLLFFVSCALSLDALAQDGAEAENQALLQSLRGGGFNL